MITRSEVSNINVRKAIRKEYTDAYFIKKAESKFISNDNVYYYTVKNRKKIGENSCYDIYFGPLLLHRP